MLEWLYVGFLGAERPVPQVKSRQSARFSREIGQERLHSGHKTMVAGDAEEADGDRRLHEAEG